MPDREKVIKGLEYCKHTDGVECPNCPYWHDDDCVETLHSDTLALLKEQEAVVPYQHDAVWLCGNCTKEVVGWTDDITGEDIRYPFCRQCGRTVKWDDRQPIWVSN